MTISYQTRCVAFEGPRRIAAGELHQVALKTKEVLDRGPQAPVLIFDESTSEPIEVDFRGTAQEVFERLTAPAPFVVPVAPQPENRPVRGPGRPRLGVVAREVTLLPRHWDWLNSQPGGASVALRRLVEEARKVRGEGDRIRQAQEATYRFISTMAGNEPDFEEATRALFAGNLGGFLALSERWPADVRDHARKLAGTP
ncbi:MAG TPA: DUF2239 family protein [Gemmatimonadales bacterium]|nr:DUF2239 family protein [Gemmatimonadales bacterium]